MPRSGPARSPALSRLAALPSPVVDRSRWVRRAFWLAWGTVVWNVLEGAVALWFGWSEESIALLGFGVDSWIEVSSAAVVLWRLRGETGRGGGPGLRRERRATRVISALFGLLAAGIALSATLALLQGSEPASTLPGLIVAAVSLSFMFALWAAKRAAARALDSRTMMMDAACSLACIHLSGVLLLGSVVFLVAPSLWWADSVAALGLAILVGREGWAGWRAAGAEDFDGGCGCGAPCEGGG